MASAPSTRMYLEKQDCSDDDDRFVVGDFVQVYACDGSFMANATVTGINYTTVPYYVEINYTWSSGNAGKMGFIQKKGAVSQLDPVVIKSSSYEVKTKGNTKNINNTIDIDKAYPINVQRN